MVPLGWRVELMAVDATPRGTGRLARLAPARQWLVLLTLSLALTFALRLANMPAALLLGPMIAGILAGTQDASVRIPRLAFAGAQSMIGCLIASVITAGVVQTIAERWPIYLATVLLIVLGTSVLGWLISRTGLLPGTTAVWGTSAGAASAMVLMSDAFGGDSRLVAVMQYLRVLMVAGSASIVARLWIDPSGAPHPTATAPWLGPFDAVALAQTLAIGVAGVAAGRLLKLPAGSILGPLIIGALLHVAGLVTIEQPPWLLAVCYTVIGWRIGLNFNRAVISHAMRALPTIILSNIALVVLCGGLAIGLHKAFGISPLTAYLATSPGGIDSIAIIAAASHVDIAFVMALQTLRLVLVLATGPTLAKFVARHGAA